MTLNRPNLDTLIERQRQAFAANLPGSDVFEHSNLSVSAR